MYHTQRNIEKQQNEMDKWINREDELAPVRQRRWNQLSECCGLGFFYISCVDIIVLANTGRKIVDQQQTSILDIIPKKNSVGRSGVFFFWYVINFPLNTLHLFSCI